MCTQRGFVSCGSILKYKLKAGLVIGCAKTLNEVTVHNHYNTVTSFNVFAHPITSPAFNLYFNILPQLTNPLCVHISKGYFIRFYFTYIVSNWDPNLHFMSQFM